MGSCSRAAAKLRSADWIAESMSTRGGRAQKSSTESAPLSATGIAAALVLNEELWTSICVTNS